MNQGKFHMDMGLLLKVDISLKVMDPIIHITSMKKVMK
jgi:hypothetical protein